MSTDPNAPGTPGGGTTGTTGSTGGMGESRPASPFGYASGDGDIARLPIPGNAEFLFWLAVVALIGIIALASDDVDAPLFAILTTAVSFAYLISRGIAKAGRVLEQ